MKKIISFTVAFILLTISSFAQAQTTNNWYFVSKGQNERPGLPSLKTASAKGIGKEEKVLYLTFDAGYENGNVEKTVDILKEENVTGAFFVLKHLVEAHPQLCQKMKENGNLVCNHTSSHPCITKITEDELKFEVENLEAIFREKTGLELDRYFRPPEGAWNEESLGVLEKMGYKTVFWSLAWADWDNNNQKSPEYAMEKLTTRVHDGAVILLHPTSETNTKILAQFISEMKNKGYRFGSLEELWTASE